MKNKPKTVKEAQVVLATVESKVERLENDQKLAFIDSSLAEMRGDRTWEKNSFKVLEHIYGKLADAKAERKEIVELLRLLVATEDRLEYERKSDRWKSIRPEVEAALKGILKAEATVVLRLRELVLACDEYRRLIEENANLKGEYNSLRAEFGNGSEPSIPDLDMWSLEVAPGIPVHEVLGSIRGRKRTERTNRHIKPLTRIDILAEAVRKAS